MGGDPPEGYWWHDIPSYAEPYPDTLFLDFGDKDFGFGIASVATLTYGQQYHATLGVKRYDGVHNSGSYPVNNVKVQAGFHDRPHPCPHPGGVAFCVFADWTHTLVRQGQLNTEQYIFVWADKLSNQGMEAGGTQAGVPSPYGTWWNINGSATTYCNDPMPAYDGSCFVQYNDAGSGGVINILQDVALNTAAGESLTGEVAVRCRIGFNQTCPVLISARAEFGGNPTENRTVTGYVVDDGHWWICRLDFDHGPSWALFDSHTNVRWEVQNQAHGNMDVDYSFLGRKTQVVANESQLFPDLVPGPVCSLAPAIF